jgi:hypothetical protein
VSARVRPLLLFIIGPILAVWVLRAVGSDAEVGAPQEWVTPQEVLVLFNARWPDEDGNYRSDSQDVAEYYAARRGVPGEHLLGLAVTERQGKSDNLAYPDFFRRVLVPTRQRLAELAARGTHIHYLVTCYGMPLVIDANIDGKRNEHPIWQPTDNDARRRALTGWLVNLEENFEAGFDRVTGKPGPRGGASAAPGSRALGTVLGDIALPWMHGAFDRPDQTNSFKALRMASPARRESYLVTHLGGETLETSLGLVDKALYAERYLQNFAGRPAHPYYGRVWLDHDGGTGAGHRPSLLTAALWFKGLLETSVFAPANRSQPWYQGPPWDVRMDNTKAEIGSRDPKDAAAPPHGATVRGVIERVEPATRVVSLVSNGDPAPAVYFPAGEVVETAGGGRAKVLMLTSHNTLKLSTVDGFRPGDTLRWRQPTGFPLTDVVFYYGYYGLKQYHDVYQFRVGAVGSHMDSGSVVWARAAIRRGITATAGAVTEPSSAGVPLMASAFAALTTGHDVAEAFYSAIPFNTRWNTVVFGDPLYAPFRTRAKRPDETPPAIERLTLLSLRSPGGGRRVLVSAQLAGATPEQADDLALWQVEYGLTPEYGSVVPYIEWPDPGDDKFSQHRRYFYTRRFTYELADLLPDRKYHVRISARDPFGNVVTTTGMVTTLP